MKIAYLVIAHRNPLLLEREIRALSSGETGFFLHIDGKSDIAAFRRLAAPNVTFLEKRYTISWAGFSIIRAMLALIERALAAPQKYDYFMLLGGSEYPLRSREYINGYLERHAGEEFIDLVKAPNEEAHVPLSHFTKFRIDSSNPVMQRAVGLIARLSFLQRDYRKHLEGLEPYGGEMWWTLSRAACEHVIEFTCTRPKVVKFFEHVQVPDEVFIHTILGNSPLRAKVTSSFVYRDWSAGGKHPAVIQDRHVTAFESADKVIQEDVFGRREALFARKLNDDQLHLVHRIDTRIAKKDRDLLESSTAREDMLLGKTA